jgi:hypothetical protein
MILDLRMPGPVDGEQLLFALGDQGNEVPVIVLSGWVDGEVRISSPACVHTRRVEETDQGGQFRRDRRLRPWGGSHVWSVSGG